MQFLSFLAFIFLIYDPGQALNRQKAIELNERAQRLFVHSTTDRATSNRLLRLYDLAIKADTTYPQAHWNKGMVLCRLGRRKEALKAFQRLARIRPDLNGVLTNEGLILDRMGLHDRAKQMYLQELAKCDSIIRATPDFSNIQTRLSRASLVQYAEGKEAGLKEFEKLVAKYPSNKFIAMQGVTYYEFDKEKEVRDFCR
jgi:tetratricopeptide (TPR) repeat protein